MDIVLGKLQGILWFFALSSLILTILKPLFKKILPMSLIMFLWYVMFSIVTFITYITYFIREKKGIWHIYAISIIIIIFSENFISNRKKNKVDKEFFKDTKRETYETFFMRWDSILYKIIVYSFYFQLINYVLTFIHILFKPEDENIFIAELFILIIWILIVLIYCVKLIHSYLYYKYNTERKEIVNNLKDFLEFLEINSERLNSVKEYENIFNNNCIRDKQTNEKVKSFFSYEIYCKENFIIGLEKFLEYILIELDDRKLFNEFYKIIMNTNIDFQKINEVINIKIKNKSSEEYPMGFKIVNNFIKFKDTIVDKFI